MSYVILVFVVIGLCSFAVMTFDAASRIYAAFLRRLAAEVIHQLIAEYGGVPKVELELGQPATAQAVAPKTDSLAPPKAEA